MDKYITEEKLLKETSNHHSNLEELGESDKYWVIENKGIQTTDIKFPTFDDNNIENQLKEELSYENLIDDSNSILELLIYFEKFFIELLSSKNKQQIINLFNVHSLNYINFIACAFFSRRKITLVFYLAKEYFEGSNDILKKVIEKEYTNVIIEKIVEDIFLITSGLEINKEDEMFCEINSLVKKNLESESFILASKLKPSIVGISIAFKFFKSIIDKTISEMKKIKIEYKEEIAIDFLQSVNK